MLRARTREAVHPIDLVALHAGIAISAVIRRLNAYDSATPDSGFDAVGDDCSDPRTLQARARDDGRCESASNHQRSKRLAWVARVRSAATRWNKSHFRVRPLLF